MKTLLFKTHSLENHELHLTSLINHQQYADIHGYDLITLNRSYSSAMKDALLWVMDMMPQYEMVVSIGSDVLFTDMKRPLESFLTPDVGVVISQEDIGGSRVNADLILWRNNEACDRVLARLIEMAPMWHAHPWGLQQAFNVMFAEPPSPDIQFPEPRILQSSPVLGFPRSLWQEGDFAIHFLGMSNEKKLASVREFIMNRKVIWRT